MEGELRELRCHYGGELYRIYYRRSGNLFVLLHIIRKLGARLPEADTAIARERWRDFKARMDGSWANFTLRQACSAASAP